MTGRPGPLALPRDAGMSLAETLVVMLIFGLLGTMVAGMSIAVTRTVGAMGGRSDNGTQAELAVDAASKVLRTAVLPQQLDTQSCSGCAATAIVSGTPTSVKFYANLGRSAVGPTLTTLKVVQDPASTTTAEMVQCMEDPTSQAGGSYTFANADPCAASSRVLARGLGYPSPTVFTYYDIDGNKIASTALTSTDLPRVSSVDLTVVDQSRPGQTRYPTVTEVQRVRLPNVEINIVVAPS